MKTQVCIWTSIVAVVLCTANSADAQWFAGNAGLNNAAWHYGLSGYGGGFSAQTPYSAEAIGMGALVRSQGAYNEQTSRAAINYEQARSIYIDNQQKAFAARRAAVRAGNTRVAEETEAAHASLARANEFLASHQPLPLPSSQLNPSTGHIEWPVALTGPDFADSRKALDGMFESQMKSGATSNLSNQIQMKTTEMKDLLRDRITQIPLNDYSQARRFLDSMIASAR